MSWKIDLVLHNRKYQAGQGMQALSLPDQDMVINGTLDEAGCGLEAQSFHCSIFVKCDGPGS